MMHGISGRKGTARRLAVFAAIALAVAAPATVAALDWPASPVAPARSFGTPGAGFLNSDIVLGSGAETLRAAGEGEILFVQMPGGRPGTFPAVSGGLVAVAHPDGMTTIYGGILPLASLHGGPVERGSPVGIPDGSGFAGRLGPTFAVGDMKSGNRVNPLVLLSAIADAKAPVIVDIALQGALSANVFAAGAAPKASILQGMYAMHVGAFDRGNAKGIDSAPFRLRLSVNGVESAARTFDVAAPAQYGLGFGGFEAPSGINLDSGGRMSLGKVFLPRGRIKVVIIAEDIAGNAKSAVWYFDVR